MAYIYKVFEHLEQLLMGIWQHTHTVITTEVSPDLGELAEILDDVNVKLSHYSGLLCAIVNVLNARHMVHGRCHPEVAEVAAVAPPLLHH